MELKFNDKANSVNDLVVFNTTPNIITVLNTGTTSTPSYITFSVHNFNVEEGKEHRFIIDGYAINGTENLEQVNNRKFSEVGDVSYVAISMINAFKNIPQLSLRYNFVFLGNGRFQIISKDNRNIKPISYSFEGWDGIDIIENVTGSSTDDLIGEVSSKVYVDLYYNNSDNQRKIKGGNEGSYKFLTTLEKEYYKDRVSFNITPVISSLSDYGNTTNIKAEVYSVVDDLYQSIGKIENVYITKGYLVNQGGTEIDLNAVSTVYPALNVSRGNHKTNIYNNSMLYIYDKHYTMSLYRPNGTSTVQVTINYLESDGAVRTTEEKTITLSDKNLQDISFDLNESEMRDSYFIDMVFPFGTLRYNVINPPYANAENNRVYWRNSYGGISFYDFTGERVEERQLNYDKYNKTLLDYYDNPNIAEQGIVYSKNNVITISLTTHLMEKDGLYQLFDLSSSYKAWIVINGVTYNIMIDSIAVNEPSDNVYTVTVKYKYSLLDSFE